MTIELTGSVEEQLRDLASRQGRDMRVLVEEAVQEYLEAAAITDVSAAEVAESQVALMGELRGDNILTVPRNRLQRLMGRCGREKVEELDHAIKAALDVK